MHVHVHCVQVFYFVIKLGLPWATMRDLYIIYFLQGHRVLINNIHTFNSELNIAFIYDKIYIKFIK